MLKKDFMRAAGEEIRSRIHLYVDKAEDIHELLPGHIVILRNARWENVSSLNQALGIDSGKDIFTDTDKAEAYIVYRDSAGNVHQMYSLVPEAFEEMDGIDNPLPQDLAVWVDNAERTSSHPKNTSDSIELEELVRLQCKSVRFQDTQKDYYDSHKTPSSVNTYTTTYRFYPIHADDSNSDYYYVEHEGIYALSNQYVSPYHESVESALSKIEEYYALQITEDCSIDDNGKLNKHLDYPSPSTTENSSSVTTGMSFKLGGQFSYTGQKNISQSFSGEIQISNSNTTTIHDVTVYNNCNDTGNDNAKWQYKFAATDCSFSFFSYGQVSLKECASAAHNTFTTRSEWIWHVENDNDRNTQMKFNISSIIRLQSSRARLTAPCKTGVANHYNDCSIPSESATLTIQKPPINAKAK